VTFHGDIFGDIESLTCETRKTWIPLVRENVTKSASDCEGITLPLKRARRWLSFRPGHRLAVNLKDWAGAVCNSLIFFYFVALAIRVDIIV